MGAASKPLESWSCWAATGADSPGSPGSVSAIYDSGDSVQNSDIVLWCRARLVAGPGDGLPPPWFKLEGFPEPGEPDGHDHAHTGGGAHHHD